MMYKLSEYVYFFRRGKLFAILQTRTRSLLELDEFEYSTLHKIWNGNADLNLSTLEKFGSEKIHLLKRDGILIDSHMDEIEELKREREEQLGSLESLHIIPTVNCNLQCKYCFVYNVHRKTSIVKNLSDKEAVNGIDFFFQDNDHKCPLVTFYGGEPLLRSELIFKSVDYIEKTLGREIEKRIITNGTILSPTIVSKLINYDFDVGVSIDGKRDAHDQNRIFKNGAGSHPIVVKNFRMLRKEGCRANILCTVGNHNLSNLKEHVEYLLSLEPSALALNLPRSTETNKETIEAGLTVEQIISTFLDCLDVCYEKHIPELHFLKLLRGYFTGEINFIPCSGCGSQIAIAPGGYVGPCQAYVVSGRYFIPCPSSKRLLFKSPSFQRWSCVNVFDSPKCSKCSIMPLCYDDCPMDRENRNGSMLQPSELHCKIRHSMLDYLISRALLGKSLAFRSVAI